MTRDRNLDISRTKANAEKAAAKEKLIQGFDAVLLLMGETLDVLNSKTPKKSEQEPE